MSRSQAWLIATCVGLALQTTMTELLIAAPAEAKKKKKAVEGEASSDSQESKDSRGASWDARSQRHGGVGLRAGTVIGSLMGGGVDAFIERGSRWQYGLLLAAGSVDLKKNVEDKDKYPDISVDEAKVDGSLMLLQARYFFGNSFYMGAGVGQRQVHAKYSLSDKQTSSAVSGEVKANSIVVHTMLGNLWSWSNGFYLGADWIALSIPVSHSYTASSSASGVVSGELGQIQKDTEDLGESLGKITSFQLAFFHLGWMF